MSILEIILSFALLFLIVALGRVYWLYDGAMKRNEQIFTAWKSLEIENKILQEVIEEL